jgi:formate-dependent nitrite reductase membrane component NrfD
VSLLDEPEHPLAPAAAEEPPADGGGREAAGAADHDVQSRDITPATGTHGEPGSWVRAVDDAHVALAGGGFQDAVWSFLFKPRDTRYAAAEPEPHEVADANRRMRGTVPDAVNGPFIKAPVWTWEVPLYFWVGGIASGASFVALACDVAGDGRSAAIARKVALGAVMPAPPLLIADLGRPERFLNMLRVFKPRSPLNMGAWCLAAFSTTAAGAVGADIVGRPREARALGALTAVLGGYLGSYTGVLLASTAVPLWARSRTFLGPIFVSTAAATGAATTRLVLVARGLPEDHPTRSALRAVQTTSILAELTLSRVNESRLGRTAESLQRGLPGVLYRSAQGAVIGGLALQVATRRREGSRLHDVASLLFLAGGLAFRFAWVYGGRMSASDDDAVASAARDREREPRLQSSVRRPVPLPRARRVWSEAVRRASLAIEHRLADRGR